MIYYLFAMQREADQIDVPNKYITGIGATSLPKTTAKDIIVNIGYCGGVGFPPGAIISPGSVRNTRGGYKVLKKEGPLCITSDVFVTTPLIDGPCIYDMELFKIAQLPCKKLYVFKIVSDNLNERACEQFSNQKVWDSIKRTLSNRNLI